MAFDVKQFEMNAQMDESIYFKSRKLRIQSKCADSEQVYPKSRHDPVKKMDLMGV